MEIFSFKATGLRLGLFLLVAIPLCAQVTITPSAANGIQDRAARVNVTLSGPANVYAQYGTTPSYGNRSNVFSGTLNAVVILFGLTPGAVTNYRICQTGFSPPTGCTANQTLTTTAYVDPTPTLPTAYSPTMPTSYAATYTVDSTCSNFDAHIATAARGDGNNNYLIQIPAGTTCGYQRTLPAKTGANPNGTGTVVISSMGTLPPEGTRIDPTQAAQMVTFLQPNIIFDTSDPPCENLSVLFRFDLGVHKVCRASNNWTLVSAEAGYSTASGDPSPLACPVAGRFYKNMAQGTQGLWYCHPTTLRWQQTQATNAQGYAINTASTAVGWRLVGIQFQNLFANQWIQYASVEMHAGASRILIDRCMKNWSSGFQGQAIGLNGANVGVINSYMALLPRLNQAPVINATSGAGPFNISNNYISGCFIPIFFNDNNATVPRSDISIVGNEITMDQRCNPRSGSYDGQGDRDPRSTVEMKRGTRVLISGNYFHDWSPGGAPVDGSAILMTPRASGSTGGDDNAYGMSDITIRYNLFRRGTGGIAIWGTDDRGFRNPRPTNKVLIEHNLGYEIDGNTYYSVSPTRAPFLYAQDGGSNYTIRNNTWIDHKGTGPAVLTFTSPMGGLNVSRNIFWLSDGNGLAGGDEGGGIRWANGSFTTLCDGTTNVTGSSAATKLALCGLPTNTFTNNAIIGGKAGYTATFQPNYPSGNFWPGDTSAGLAAMGFTSTYRLALGSAYAPLGVGADIDLIDAARSITSNERAISITTTTATITYRAPDATKSCTVENVATGSRTTDTSGSLSRSVALTGLTTGTTYTYRIMCTQISTVTFITSTVGSKQTTRNASRSSRNKTGHLSVCLLKQSGGRLR